MTDSLTASPTLNEYETRFLNRIERRVRFFKQIQSAELAIYLPAQKDQRDNAIRALALTIARTQELARLTPEVLQYGIDMIIKALEQMQPLLPYDIQHRNRNRRKQEW